MPVRSAADAAAQNDLFEERALAHDVAGHSGKSHSYALLEEQEGHSSPVEVRRTAGKQLEVTSATPSPDAATVAAHNGSEGTDDVLSSPTGGATDEKTALVRSILVQRAEAVLEMTSAEEAIRADTDAVVAPITIEAPPVRPKLTLGNFMATYVPARLLGVTYLSVSAVIFSVMSLFVSLVSDYMPSMQIVMFRCIMQFAFGFTACRLKDIYFLGPRPKWKWLFLRGFLGCSGFSLYYYAISQLTLADATTIFFTSPLFTGFFGYIFLRESVARFDIVCTLSSVIGMVMVVRPAFIFGSSDSSSAADNNTSSAHTAGIIAAICGSLVSACVYIAIRKVGPGVEPLVLTTYMGMVGCIFTPFGGLAQTFQWPSTFVTYFYLLMIGIFSFTGQILFNAGVQREKAGPASMIRNLDVAFSFLWQITIEGIAPNVWSVFGALIISSAVVAMGIKKWRSDSAPKPPVAPAVVDPSATTSTDPTSELVVELVHISDGSTPVPSRKSSSAAPGLSLHELTVLEGDESLGDDADVNVDLIVPIAPHEPYLDEEYVPEGRRPRPKWHE